jgi:hypothetical protein
MARYLTGFGAGHAAGEEFLRTGKVAILPKYIKSYNAICDFWSGYNAALAMAEKIKKYRQNCEA